MSPVIIRCCRRDLEDLVVAGVDIREDDDIGDDDDDVIISHAQL